MQYSILGNTGIRLSRLGFGAMRLPMVEDSDGNHVDYDKAVAVIHRAFELGVNYIDTAYGYCQGTSEIAVGRALKGWRDKVYLSTKCPTWNVQKKGDYRRLLEEQLKKLDTDWIDFYHMHGLNNDRFRNTVLALDLYDEMAKAKEEGLIRFSSFSFHDKPQLMKEIADSGQFSSVLCQYNLLDRSNEDAIEYVSSKGLGVIVMGPVGGGRLSHSSEIIMGMASGSASTAETAIRFVLANPHVNVALSGMSTVAMVEENAAVASLSEPLSDAEKISIAQALERSKELAKLYCTGCEYCMPCPNGVNIPKNFQAMIYHKVYGLTSYAKSEYAKITGDKGQKADACLECGQCETKCPQNIKIVEQLKEVARVLGA